MYIVGPNAAGKSNFLDVFIFMRDIVKDGGGLQYAVNIREGLSKIRCLSGREIPGIELEFSLSENGQNSLKWRYILGIKSEDWGKHRPKVIKEQVWKEDSCILNRPNDDDEKDPEKLVETFLQYRGSNQSFREIYNHFDSCAYLNIIPQVFRFPDMFSKMNVRKAEDAFGFYFLERMMEVPEPTRKSRLKKIENVLQLAVPQLKALSDTKDVNGVPHLEAIYQHWRPRGAKQTEKQFSDGTIRLIGLLWMFLENNSLLLLEEPEISLFKIGKMKKEKQQILISTHSYDLLSDISIGGDSILVLVPGNEGTTMFTATSKPEIKTLLESGMSPAEAVIPFTKPETFEKYIEMDLFE